MRYSKQTVITDGADGADGDTIVNFTANDVRFGKRDNILERRKK